MPPRRAAMPVRRLGAGNAMQRSGMRRKDQYMEEKHQRESGISEDSFVDSEAAFEARLSLGICLLLYEIYLHTSAKVPAFLCPCRKTKQLALRARQTRLGYFDRRAVPPRKQGRPKLHA